MACTDKGIVAIRKPGQTTCVNHRHINLDWFCETDGEVICAKCISTTHRGHYCIQLSDIIPQHKQKIREFIQDTERNKVTKIQEEINSTEDNFKKQSSHFESIAREVLQQGEKLKEELDILTAQTLSRLKHLEEENSKILRGYQNELEGKLEGLKSQLKECKESLQNGTDIQVFDVAGRLTSNLKLPSYPVLDAVKFTPTANPKHLLEQSLGILASTSTVYSHGYQRHQASVCDDDRRLYLPKQISDTSEKFIKPVTSLLPMTKVLSECKSLSDVCSIYPDNSGGIWTCDSSHTIVSNSIRHGEEELVFACPVQVIDICTSPFTHNLWVCSEADKSVSELVSNKSGDSTLWILQISICISNGDNVLVGMSRKITKFSPQGNSLTSAKSNNGTPLVFTPRRISCCPNSGQIAVADRDLLGDGGKAKPHITVLNQHLQELYQYGQERHTSRAGKKPFDPWDLKYDNQGRLIISDLNNCCLHALSPNGQYLRLLHTDTGVAMAVGIDVNKTLWAVFGNHGDQTIKCIKYT